MFRPPEGVPSTSPLFPTTVKILVKPNSQPHPSPTPQYPMQTYPSSILSQVPVSRDVSVFDLRPPLTNHKR